MSSTCPVDATAGARRRGGSPLAALGPAKWLGLAATPTFAIMAVLTGIFGGGMDMICSAGHGSLLDGMVPMYVLMSAFHASAWLKLLSDRRHAGRRSGLDS